MTAPETHRTLLEQQKQLVLGHRHVQMFPGGQRELGLPHGFARTQINGDVFHFDPRHITAAQIHSASLRGHENHLLGLGPHSKSDVALGILRGEPMVAVVEHTGDGHEVRSAAGTHSTAPSQYMHMLAHASPGNMVSILHPAHVLKHRLGI